MAAVLRFAPVAGELFRRTVHVNPRRYEGGDSCAVHRGISFAALPALADDDCDQIEANVGNGPNCWERLNAQFRKGKLIQLTCCVEAEGGPEFAFNQVVSALTRKFGKREETVHSLRFVSTNCMVERYRDFVCVRA